MPCETRLCSMKISNDLFYQAVEKESNYLFGHWKPSGTFQIFFPLQDHNNREVVFVGVSEGFECSRLTPQRHSSLVEEMPREERLSWSRLKACHLPRTLSYILSSSLSHLSSLQSCLCDFQCSSLCLCFSFLFSLLSFLSFIPQRLPTSTSPALLVCLFSPPLALFLHWLPTHLFLYTCLLTNGCGRCSPRCLNTTAEPLKDLASAPWPLPWHGLTSKPSAAKKLQSRHVHTCLLPQIYRHTHTQTHINIYKASKIHPVLSVFCGCFGFRCMTDWSVPAHLVLSWIAQRMIHKQSTHTNMHNL